MTSKSAISLFYLASLGVPQFVLSLSGWCKGQYFYRDQIRGDGS